MAPDLWPKSLCSPDVGLDAHAAILQTGIHGEVNGVGGLPAVVLVDQHRVLCDVMACSVPAEGGQTWTHVHM